MTAPSVAPIRNTLAIVCGSIFEFYDFGIYAFLAVQIGHSFFPADSEAAGLMLSLSVFGIGYLARPLGAFVIGRYADRAGRKPAMLLSLGSMAAATALLVTIPPYDRIGIAAPLLAALARIVQGFAIGGEIGPVMAYLVEVAPPGKRGRYGAWQALSQGLAVMMAGLVATILTRMLGAQALDAWGWRLAFVPGLLIVPAGLWIRSAVTETLGRTQDRADDIGMQPRRWPVRVIVAGMLTGAGAAIVTSAILFMASFGNFALHLPPGLALAAPLIAGLSSIAIGFPAAMLSDRIGWRFSLSGWALLLVTAYPIFSWMVAVPGPRSFLTGVSVLSGAFAICVVPMQIWFAEALPQAARSTTVGIVCAVTVTIFGGSTQLVLTSLIAWGGAIMPAWVMMTAAAMGLAGGLLMPAIRREIVQDRSR